jgi:hypothetical protein
MAFGAPPRVEAIRSIEPLAEAGVMAGTGCIGAGYDVFGAYAEVTALKRQLVDFAAWETDPSTGLKRPTIVEVRTDAGSGSVYRVEGRSVREFQSNMATKASLSGSYGFFAGSADARFDLSLQQTTSLAFAEVRDRYLYWKLLLPPPSMLRAHLKPAVQEMIDEADPAELIDAYGTHYLASVLVGALASYSCAVETSTRNSKMSIGAAAELSYRWLTGSGKGGMSTEQQTAVTDFQKSSVSHVRVQGGDQSLAGKLLDPGGFGPWRQSVPDHLAMADLDDDSLRPVSMLAQGSRRAVLEAAIAARFAAHPPAPEAVIIPVFAWHHLSSEDKTPLSRWYYSTQPDGPSGWNTVTSVQFYAFRDGSNEPELRPVYRFRADNPPRYRLHMDPNLGQGWGQGAVAFYAWPTPGPGRVPFDGYVSDATPHSGWHYQPTGTPVGRWTVRQSGVFFVPKLG